MFNRIKNWLWRRIVDWLNSSPKEELTVFCNFDRLQREVRPADVILFEGRTHIGEVIKIVTLSPWTHSAIYIGRPVDIQDPATRRRLAQYYNGDPYEPLIVESLLGKGTIVTPLSEYRDEHLRICRPSSIAVEDVHKVVDFSIEQLGLEYDVQQLLDLARLTFPYAILPRKWRSSLFQHNAGKPTHIICSSMIARCFQQVNYPILPILCSQKDKRCVRFHKRDFRLFVPSDFDYSPYFKVVKYSFWGFGDESGYRQIQWEEEEESTDANHKNPKEDENPANQQPLIRLDHITQTLSSVIKLNGKRWSFTARKPSNAGRKQCSG